MPDPTRYPGWRLLLSGVVIYSVVSLAVIGGLVLYSNRLYHNAVRGCQQQNVARQAANDSSSSLRSFLGIVIAGSVKRARTVDAKLPKRKALDLSAVDLYTDLRNAQTAVPLLDCKDINHQPWPLG